MDDAIKRETKKMDYDKKRKELILKNLRLKNLLLEQELEKGSNKPNVTDESKASSPFFTTVEQCIHHWVPNKTMTSSESGVKRYYYSHWGGDSPCN